MTTQQKILLLKFDNDIIKRSRFKRILLAIDQLINVVWLNGSQDETVSSYIGRTGKHKWLCSMLRKIQSKHCRRSLSE